MIIIPKKDWPSFTMRSAGRFYLMVKKILINAEDRIGFQQSMERLSFQGTIVWLEISHIDVFGQISRSKVNGMKINEQFFKFLRRNLRV